MKNANTGVKEEVRGLSEDDIALLPPEKLEELLQKLDAEREAGFALLAGNPDEEQIEIIKAQLLREAEDETGYKGHLPYAQRRLKVFKKKVKKKT